MRLKNEKRYLLNLTVSGEGQFALEAPKSSTAYVHDKTRCGRSVNSQLLTRWHSNCWSFSPETAPKADHLQHPII